MVQTVELLLDGRLDEAVRDGWRTLAAAGLPSQARHTSSSNRPHVTLAVATAMPAHVDEAVADVVSGLLPVPVRLGAVVLFGSRRTVVARIVVPSTALLELHARVQRVTADCPGPGALLEPGRWTAHVTLARGVRHDQVGAVVAALGGVQELDGRAVGVRRWDGDQRVERLLAGDPPTWQT